VRRLALTGLVLVVLVVGYLVVDVVAKGYVEGRVEDEFRESPRLQAEDVSFAIDSFPFLFRLAAFSEVSATVELDGVQDQGLTIDRFTLDVDGLEFDRMSAFNGDFEATDLDRATASIDLSEQTITDLVGVPVEISEGGQVTAGGSTVQAVMDGGSLVVSGEGFSPVTVPLDLSRYLPCAPDTEVLEGSVHLSCVTEELPPIVNRVIGEAIDEG
jgi:LmeA-like phospholipid-binding